jgi:hypothetical protein
MTIPAEDLEQNRTQNPNRTPFQGSDIHFRLHFMHQSTTFPALTLAPPHIFLPRDTNDGSTPSLKILIRFEIAAEENRSSRLGRRRWSNRSCGSR